MSSGTSHDLDAFDRDVLRHDDARGPSAGFVAELRMSLVHEARRLQSVEPHVGQAVPAAKRFAVVVPAPSVRRSIWSRGVAPALSRFATIGLVIVLLLVSVTWLDDRASPERRSDIPAGYAVATPDQTPRTFANVPMPGGNPARTNEQPGPGLDAPPDLGERAQVSGRAMVTADGVIVITDQTAGSMTALDASSLRELWSVMLPLGVGSPPAIGGGRIYLTLTGNTERASDRDADYQLVAFSARDGSELWRTDGAGIYSTGAIVDGEVVYSLGVSDRRSVVGAYRAADGRTIWRTEIGDYDWCCPDAGIALANGLIAVSDATSIGVVEAASGRLLWNRTFESNQRVSTPLMIEGLVVANVAAEPGMDLEAESEVGSTMAFAIRSGELRWSNRETRSIWAVLSASPSGILYAGGWQGEESAQIALLTIDSGETVWKIPAPLQDGDPRILTGFTIPPVVVGETAYVASGAVPLGGSPVGSSLITAMELATGSIRWQALIDGNIGTSPIVINGRMYILTADAGLTVLEERAEQASSDAVVDLRARVACNAPSVGSPLLAELPSPPTRSALAPWPQAILFSQIWPPTGEPVDPSVAGQLTQRFNEYRACSQAEPYGGVFGFFSTDFFVRLLGLDEAVYGSKAQPWAVWMAPMEEWLQLETNSLRIWPDGRIGGIVNSPVQNVYVWWVQEDGVWKIDEYHRILADPVDPNAATPSSGDAEGDQLG